jgi:hypothetical protein
MAKTGSLKLKKTGVDRTGGVLPKKMEIFCLTLFWYSPTYVVDQTFSDAFNIQL